MKHAMPTCPFAPRIIGSVRFSAPTLVKFLSPGCCGNNRTSTAEIRWERPASRRRGLLGISPTIALKLMGKYQRVFRGPPTASRLEWRRMN